MVLLPEQSDDHRQQERGSGKKSLTELAGMAAKARPSPATAGTAGAGSGSHIAALYFESVSGIKLQYVPFIAARRRP